MSTRPEHISPVPGGPPGPPGPPDPADPEFGRSFRNLSGRSFSSISGFQIAKEAVVSFKHSLPIGYLPPGWNHGGNGRFDSIPTKHAIGKTKTRRKLKVCIVGAGAAGLRIAMFLNFLGVDYDFLEASDRHGGRVFTHHFSRAENDYYDVGAMRFPRTQALEQTFALFQELGLNAGPDGKIINYVMSIPANIQLFNNRRTTNAEASIQDDPHWDEPHVPFNCLTYGFHVGARNFKGASAISAAAMEPFKVALAEDFQAGWAALMTQDHLTTREFMRAFLVAEGLVPANQPRQQFVVLQWMERNCSSTGAYDFAIAQEILESMEFDYPSGYGHPAANDGPQEWNCIAGGTEVVTDRMHRSIFKKLYYKHRVVAVTAGPGAQMSVKVLGQPDFDNRHYAHIILTTALGCVNQMDLTAAELTYDQREAVRSLSYGSAMKIGIKFRTRWWEELEDGFNQFGGVSYTDRPIRVVVYPSYGPVGPPDNFGVLIASYAWTQDAVRLGTNIQGNRSVVEQELLDIVYNNLAAVHPQHTAEWYRQQTISHFAHDWCHDEFTLGAYAQFHPGQYNYTYGALTKPGAGGYLHFSGEAISAHHTWIEGALVAAWRSVYQILWIEGRDDLLAQFLEKWPPPDEIEPELENWQVMRAVHLHDTETAAIAAANAGAVPGAG